jgi:hypothetical protein
LKLHLEKDRLKIKGRRLSQNMSEEPPPKKRKQMANGSEASEAGRNSLRYTKREERKTDPTSFPQVPCLSNIAKNCRKSIIGKERMQMSFLTIVLTSTAHYRFVANV